MKVDFNRGVALLHSFEFRAAMETFNAVLARDAFCAVEYWGIALCHWGNPFAGIKTGAAARARPRCSRQGALDRNADAARTQVPRRGG